MTSIGDTAGYSTGWFTPKQTFTTRRTVSWDVNLTDLGGRQWWEVAIVPAAYNSGVADCAHSARPSTGCPRSPHLPAHPAGSVAVANGPGGGRRSTSSTNGRRSKRHASTYRTCNFDPEGCASKAIRRTFSITDNRNGTDHGELRRVRHLTPSPVRSRPEASTWCSRTTTTPRTRTARPSATPGTGTTSSSSDAKA